MRTSENLTFLDAISIASFLIGLENLDLNITQEDVQSLENQMSKKLEASIKDVHDHLAIQDIKLNHIIRLLEEQKNDSRRDF